MLINNNYVAYINTTKKNLCCPDFYDLDHNQDHTGPRKRLDQKTPYGVFCKIIGIALEG